MQTDSPDIQVGGFSLWVPGSQGDEDGWLFVTARYQDPHCRICVEGAYLQVHDLWRFHEELLAMNDSLRGNAVLAGHEPNLSLALAMKGQGRAEAQLRLTPDHLHSLHEIRFALDQSFLPALLRASRALCRRIPLR